MLLENFTTFFVDGAAWKIVEERGDALLAFLKQLLDEVIIVFGHLVQLFLRDDSGFWAKFPPEGITVESWYVAMGLGHVVTLRVSPARLREVNRSIEQNAWKVFRTEIYLTYDFREIARSQREKALAK